MEKPNGQAVPFLGVYAGFNDNVEEHGGLKESKKSGESSKISPSQMRLQELENRQKYLKSLKLTYPKQVPWEGDRLRIKTVPGYQESENDRLYNLSLKKEPKQQQQNRP